MPPIKPGPSANLDAYRAALAKRADKMPTAEIAGAKLTPTDLDKKLTGANVKFHAEDAKGTKFTFKPYQPGSTNFQRDQFAGTLRAEAGEAVVRVIPQKLTLPSGQKLEGYVKPKLGKTEALSAEPTQWSEVQRGQLLADAPWAEFLGNYDLKLDQYASVSLDDKLPQKALIDGDWDVSLSDYEFPQPLDRFKAFKVGLTAKNIVPAAPPTQNLMYEAYVHGKIDLDFQPMYAAIGRIQALPEKDVRASLAPFIAAQFAKGKSFGQYKNGEELVQAVLARQRSLRTKFEGFETSLKTERTHYQNRNVPSPSDGKTWVKEKWMHLGNWFVQSPLLGWMNRRSQHKKAEEMGIKVN